MKLLVKSHFFIWLVLFGFVLSSASTLVAQSDNLVWSEPERVWGYEDGADPPFMVADQNRTVHAMNSRVGPGGAIDGIDITYRRWNPDQGWSEPVDVILSPKKNIARIKGLMLDAQGYLHMVFYGGDEQDASIFYTYAPALTANDARSWSKPLELAPFAGPINDAAVIGDGNQRLFVVYTGNAEGLGAYAVYSLDGGLTWSKPESIHISSPGQFPTQYALFLNDQQRLHAAWSEADASGNGQLLYYANLDENQTNWSTPVIIEEVRDFSIYSPSLFEYGNELLLIYFNGSPTTRWLRTSRDHGNTWSNPERMFNNLIGSDRPVSLVKDSGGTLHAFFGNRTTSNPAFHGMWHSIYVNGRFNQPEAIVLGPPVGDSGDEPFDPQFARAVVVQGNKILLLWRQDPVLRRSKIWNSSITLDTPELPLFPLVFSRNDVTPQPTPSPTAIPLTPTPLPASILQPPPTNPPGSALGGALLWAILPVALLVGVIMILRWRRRVV